MNNPTPVSTAANLRRKRLQADLLLLLTAMIWGSAFVVQRVVALQSGVFWFNGLRFLTAAVALAPFAWSGLPIAPGGARLGRRSIAGVAAAGLAMVGGAALQQAGLRYTTAGNAGFITGLYVVLVPIFLSIIWRQRLQTSLWIAAGLSVAGLYLLTANERLRINPGDALELAGAFFWAGHVIVVGRMVQRVHVLQFAVGQYLVCAVLNLLLGVWLEPGMLPHGSAGIAAVLYAGLISVGVGYTLQALAQRTAPPADAAIILSSEAVFAALAGWIFLSETLGLMQLLGCGVMLAGMLLAQMDVGKEPSAPVD